MEPIKGGNEEGAVGVLKGTAKGIGGYEPEEDKRQRCKLINTNM